MAGIARQDFLAISSDFVSLFEQTYCGEGGKSLGQSRERKRNKALFASRERRDVVARGPVRGADSPWRGSFGPGTEVAEADRTACGRNAAFMPTLRMSYSAASTLPAPRRSTRLAQYGGPRAGVRFGTSVGSPMPRRYRATLVGSVTSASSFILPLQHGHVRTSNPKVRLRSSAHGR
jgi:hypothetical protein